MRHLTKPFCDPLGNLVQLPLIFSNCGHSYEEISQVIQSPSFMIQQKHERLYFFRLINSGTNIVVEARLCNEQFIVNNWFENPAIEYISALLQKGALVSFR